MNITLQNYGEYFVRFLDGELSADEAAALQIFLNQYPHLQSEMNAFKATILPVDEEILFPGKHLLKKGISLTNYTDYFIRHVEHDLSAEETTELYTFLQQHADLRFEFSAYEATRLVADTSIVFPDKKSLRKKEGGRMVPLYVRYIMVAAVAASLMFIVFIKGMPWQNQHLTGPVAEQERSPVLPKDQDAEKNINGISNPVNPSQVVSNESVASEEHPTTTGANPNKKVSTLKLVAAAENQSGDVKEDRSSGLAMNSSEMDRIGTEIPPISYQPRFKKAMYRRIGTSGNQKAAEDSKPVKLTSVATALGSELLRLTGREDYLKTSSAFNDEGKPQKKLPVILSIKGSKFDFYHKFFKKRGQSSSEKNQN